MKKYTCPDCGKVFLNRKPKACPQCGCVSENFIVSELVVQEEGAPQPQVTQPVQQPVQPQYQQVPPQYQQPYQQVPPQYQQPYQPQYQQPQYAVPAAQVQVSLESMVNFLSVVILLAGVAFGLVVIIMGAGEASEWNKIYDVARRYREEGEPNLHQSVAIPVLTGLAIMFLSIIQFVITRLFVKTSKRVEALEAKVK